MGKALSSPPAAGGRVIFGEQSRVNFRECRSESSDIHNLLTRYAQLKHEFEVTIINMARAMQPAKQVVLPGAEFSSRQTGLLDTAHIEDIKIKESSVMAQDELRANIAEEFGLSRLSVAEQEKYIDSISNMLIESVVERSIDVMDSEAMIAFDELTDTSGTDPYQVFAFLRSRVPSFEEICAEERSRLKRAMANLF